MSEERYFEGFAVVRQLPPQGMITLRGDLGSAPLKKAARAATGGADFPAQGMCSIAGNAGIAWMSPDEALILCDYAGAGQTVEKISKTMKSEHHLAVNVSDARVVFDISGQGAREVLAKLAPVDLHPDAFGPGQFRRTRLAQVGVAFWLQDDGAFRLVCFRSVADYVWGILTNAADAGGKVGVLT